MYNQYSCQLVAVPFLANYQLNYCIFAAIPLNWNCCGMRELSCQSNLVEHNIMPLPSQS